MRFKLDSDWTGRPHVRRATEPEQLGLLTTLPSVSDSDWTHRGGARRQLSGRVGPRVQTPTQRRPATPPAGRAGHRVFTPTRAGLARRDEAQEPRDSDADSPNGFTSAF